jgi:hypothetical protein
VENVYIKRKQKTNNSGADFLFFFLSVWRNSGRETCSNVATLKMDLLSVSIGLHNGGLSSFMASLFPYEENKLADEEG